MRERQESSHSKSTLRSYIDISNHSFKEVESLFHALSDIMIMLLLPRLLRFCQRGSQNPLSRQRLLTCMSVVEISAVMKASKAPSLQLISTYLELMQPCNNPSKVAASLCGEAFTRASVRPSLHSVKEGQIQRRSD